MLYTFFICLTCSLENNVIDYRFEDNAQDIVGIYLRNECLFFLGSWGMNRSAGQTNRKNLEAVLGRFVLF